MGPTQADPEAGTTGSDWAQRAGGQLDAYLRARSGTENFPVALRVLPRAPRTHLSAIYDVARVIDDLGDEAPGDRSALLREFCDDAALIWRGGEPTTPVLRRLAGTVAACSLDEQPFVDLIEANLQDQTVTVYPTYADLAAYCELSANPVGRLVLQVFGVSTPERVELSDRICTALQIIEHCQDVAEDRRAGRIYLPLEDLDTYGVVQTDLDAPVTSPALARLVAYETERAMALLDSGLPLIDELHGWVRLAVSGYIAGGKSAVFALRRAKWDVMRRSPQTRRLDVIQQIIATMTRRKVRA
jgi:squalene synthase HpnC